MGRKENIWSGAISPWKMFPPRRPNRSSIFATSYITVFSTPGAQNVFVNYDLGYYVQDAAAPEKESLMQAIASVS